MKPVSLVVSLLIAWLTAAAAGAGEDMLLQAHFDGALSAGLTSSAPADFAPGIQGQAVVLDQDNALQFPAPPEYQREQGTLMMWLRPTWSSASMGASHNRTLLDWGGVCLIYYAGYTKGYNALLRKGNCKDIAIVSSEDTHFDADTWHHFGLTWDHQKGLSVYINGVRAAETEDSWAVCPNPGPSLSFGQGGGLTGFDAAFDDLYFYARELSAEEVRQHYVAARTGQALDDVEPAPPSTEPQPHLTAVTKFELPLDLGTVCEFGSVSWQTSSQDVHVDVTTSSLGISAWGGQWGARWSMAEPIENGFEVFSPAGRHLKLQFTVTAATPLDQLPLETLTVEYRPVAESAAEMKLLHADVSRAVEPVETIGKVDLSPGVETPHVKWAQPFSAGPTRVLFLTNFDMQREAFELDQRMELIYDLPLMLKHWNFTSTATFYRHRFTIHSGMDALDKLTADKQYDVIVSGGNSWDSISPAIQERLLGMVKAGTGLVLCLDPKQLGALKDIVPLQEFVATDRTGEVDPALIPWNLSGERKGPWQAARNHFLTIGIPYPALPATNYYAFEKGRNVLVKSGDDPIMAVGRHGQGRIVQFSHSSPGCWGGNSALVPSVGECGVTFDYWEYYLSQMGKAILWAAGKEPALRIVELSAPPQVAADQPNAVSVTLENTTPTGSFFPAEPMDLTVEATIRDEFSAVQDVVTQQITLQTGPGNRQKLSLPLPSALEHGLHFADIIVRQEEKVENWGSVSFMVQQTARIESVQTDQELYDLGATVTVDVQLTGAAAPLDVKLDIYDSHDRLVATYRRPADAAQATFNHDLNNPLSHFARLHCELLSGDDVLDVAEKELHVAFPHQWDDYEVIGWGMTGMLLVDYVIPFYYEPLRELGLTSILEGYNFYNLTVQHARNNFTAAPIGVRQGMTFHAGEAVKAYRETSDKTALARTPCLNDPAFQRSSDNAVREATTDYAWMGPVGYCMGDEGSLVSCGIPRRPSHAVDVCFSPHCQAQFRIWLRKKYGDLAGLNTQWGTDFPQWDDVLAATKEEIAARTDGNFSAWADHRDFMSDTWAATYQRWQNVQLTQDPGAEIGISGTGPPSVYTGSDYWKLGNVFGYINLYRWISQGEIWSSFFPDKNYTHWAGYGALTEAEPRYGIWWSIMNKHRGIAYWKVQLFVHPDLNFTSHGRHIRDNLIDVKQGIGKIVMHAEKKHDGIAILYSQPSLRAAWITGAGRPRAEASPYEYHEINKEGPDISWDEIRYIDNLDTYCMLLKAAGLGYRFVSCEQVADGVLSAQQYRAVILPFAMALPESAVQQIRDFTQDGGLVVADVLPGVMDGSCKTLPRSALADVFGADIAGNQWQRQPGTITLTTDTFTPLTAFEPALGPAAVQVTTGHPQGIYRRAKVEIPTIIAHDYGKGQAVYLNSFLSNLADHASWQRDRDLLLQIFDAAGIQPQVTLTKNGAEPALGFETAVFQDGPVRYLMVLRDQKITAFDDVEQAIDIALPDSTHVYDVRRRAYLDRTQKLQKTLLPGDAAFYALLPYQVQAIQADTDKPSYRPGEVVTCDLTVQTTDVAGNHVVRIEVIDPQGHLQWQYSKNLHAPNGKASHRIPLALNDPTGTWRLRLRDVTTGVQQETTFEVAP